MSSKSPKHSYQHYIENTEYRDNPARIAEPRFVYAVQRLRHCERVLDLGCNDALLARLIEGTYVGLELNRYALKFAREKIKKGDVLIWGNAEQMPFLLDDWFDGLMCGELIEHVPRPETMLDEMHRVLKPGGIAIVTSPAAPKAIGPGGKLIVGDDVYVLDASGALEIILIPDKGGHLREYSPRALVEVVRKHGFDVVDMLVEDIYPGRPGTIIKAVKR